MLKPSSIRRYGLSNNDVYSTPFKFKLGCNEFNVKGLCWCSSGEQDQLWTERPLVRFEQPNENMFGAYALIELKKWTKIFTLAELPETKMLKRAQSGAK